MKTDLKILREYIKQIVSEMNRTKEEASTTASVSGYTLPMGTSNKKKKRKDDVTDELVWKSYAKAFGNAKKI
jgi:hypothetical protein